ncbi:outer membrane protein assembly factor BamB family protein [Yinghuangia sp. YIM S09857]|uniref:serine/threonine-protein kinase n=1 Tax=Yinghuangia sp. YIM S09857 TaxID=3436929 RepID=UPI003F52D732
MRDLEPGDPHRLGDHELVGVLGTGGFGRVFMARTPQGKRLAVKVTHPHLLRADPDFATRFAGVMGDLSRVRNLGAGRIVDWRADDVRPWYARRYVPGASLVEVLAAGGPLPHAALRIVAGVARGLAAMHDAELPHGGVTPGNVLLTVSTAQLVDGGLARVFGGSARSGGAAVPLTGPAFAPPEGGAEATLAADAYALGVLLILCVRGHLPEGPDPRDVLADVPTADLPDGVAQLAARLLDPVPESRATVAQVVAQLGRPGGELATHLPRAARRVISAHAEGIGQDEPPTGSDAALPHPPRAPAAMGPAGGAPALGAIPRTRQGTAVGQATAAVVPAAPATETGTSTTGPKPAGKRSAGAGSAAAGGRGRRTAGPTPDARERESGPRLVPEDGLAHDAGQLATARDAAADAARAGARGSGSSSRHDSAGDAVHDKSRGATRDGYGDAAADTARGAARDTADVVKGSATRDDARGSVGSSAHDSRDGEHRAHDGHGASGGPGHPAVATPGLSASPSPDQAAALGAQCLWTREVPGVQSLFMSDGLVFAGGDSLVALAPATGEPVWSKPGWRIVGEPRDGHVHVTQGTRLALLDAATGTERWRTDVAAARGLWARGTSRLARAERAFRLHAVFEPAAGVLAAIGGHTEIFGLDPATGELLWNRREPRRTAFTRDDAGAVYLSGDGREPMRALDPRTGELLWHDDAEDSIVTAVDRGWVLCARFRPGTAEVGSYVVRAAENGGLVHRDISPGDTAVLENGVLFVLGGGEFRALRPAQAAQLWSTPWSGGTAGLSLAVDSAEAYLRGEDRRVHAVDLADGSVRWTSDPIPARRPLDAVGGQLDRTLPVLADGPLVCVRSHSDSVLIVLDRADGRELWWWRAWYGTLTMVAPVVSGAFVYVVDGDRVRALTGRDTGEAGSA